MNERKERVRAVCDLYLDRGWSADSPNAMADAIEDLQAVSDALLEAWQLEQAYKTA
jgi:predicted RNA-binding protein associated with RNAse of E/G family